VLGPGSLLTSVVPNLLIKGLPEAIADSRAQLLYILNVMTQPGQTDAFDASSHVEFIQPYLKGKGLDGVVVNTEHPPEPLLKKYRDDGAEFVGPTPALES